VSSPAPSTSLRRPGRSAPCSTSTFLNILLRIERSW
jgi:hypothetical protein